MPKATAVMIARWFDAHGRALVLYARQLLADRPAEADDVVQNLFVRLLTLAAGNGVDEPPNPAAWLHKCLHNACLDERRGRRRRIRREHENVRHRRGWFETNPDDLIDAAAAQEALAALPEVARQVVTLRIWSGLTLAETADVTGLPVSTVHDQYRRALGQLRAAMESRSLGTRSRHET